MRTIEEIREEALTCTRCPLAQTRRNVVFGNGPSNARYVCVAERPGEQENLTGRACSGEVGRYLNTALLPAVGVARDELFITHSVMCTPPLNRAPTKEEANACRPWLMEILYTIDPVLAFAMGLEAVEALTGVQMAVTHKYGSIMLASVPGRLTPYHLPVVVVSSPGFVRRLNECAADGKQPIPKNSHIHRWLWAFQYHILWGDQLCQEWFGEVPPQRGVTLFDVPEQFDLAPRIAPDYDEAELQAVVNNRFLPTDLAEDVDGDPYAETPSEIDERTVGNFVDQTDHEDDAEDLGDEVDEGPTE